MEKSFISYLVLCSMLVVPFTPSMVFMIDIYWQQPTELINAAIDDSAVLPFGGFVLNQGQVPDKQVQFYAHGHNLAFGESSILLGTGIEEIGDIRVSFPGSENSIARGAGQTEHRVNYFLGKNWITNIPTFEEVWYDDLYPGIDLRFKMTPAGLKYDFLVNPRADPSVICVQFNGDVRLQVSHDEVSAVATIDNALEIINDSGLEAFQQNGELVPASFVSMGETGIAYGFDLGPYDTCQQLIIDPIWIVAATYLGGTDNDGFESIKTDAAGFTYITGGTQSYDFPTFNAFNETYSGYDAYVVKLNQTGTGFVYSTFFGGSSADAATAICVDSVGSVYITGETSSDDFPLVNSIEDSRSGSTDAFVTKFSAAGDSLIYSSLFGGSHWDRSRDITVDTTGCAIITGVTFSDNYPLVNPIQSSLQAHWTGIVSKLNSTGNGFVFSTLLGGDGGVPEENGATLTGVAVDSDDYIYVGGYTQSENLPVLSAFQSAYGGGENDGMAAKISATGVLQYCTYLGGSGNEYLRDLEVDTEGSCILVGVTGSTDYPTLNPIQENSAGGYGDVFVASLNTTGTGLVFSTYLGGSDYDECEGIALASDEEIAIIGRTYSHDFPLMHAFKTGFQADWAGFASRLNATGTSIEYSTFLPSEGTQWRSIAIAPNGDFVVGCRTSQDDLPIRDAIQEDFAGDWDGYVLRITCQIDNVPPSIMTSGPVNGTITQSGVDIGVVADDDLSGVREGEFSWDGAANVSLAEATVSIPAGDGWHNLSVFVEDWAGNERELHQMFLVDDTNPSISGLSDLGVDWNVGDEAPIVQLVWGVSDIHPSKYEVFVDDVLETSSGWSEPSDTIVLTKRLGTLGYHYFEVNATDQAGNFETFFTRVLVSQIGSTPPPDGIPFEIVLFLGLGAVLFAVAVVIVLKKR
ncbi:MAG: hypothetical protein EAX95_03945 [Candidatus Thorarchaeota archaeon]|nr:hypothetical protein [Candidatus Thorarchaeota archaeon]